MSWKKNPGIESCKVATYKSTKVLRVNAEAGNIEYSASNEIVILLGNARVWQTGGEEFRSERIVFNLKDSTVNAGGTTTRDRVHITLQPKNKPDKKP